MQTSSTEVVYFTIVITTLLLLVFGSIIIRYIFLYQKRRYSHKQEVLELKKAYTQNLLESKLAIREQTLDYVGKELHANIAHLASLININLAALQEETEEAGERVGETKQLAKRLLAELKALSTGLNTDFLKRIGFAQALNNEIKLLEKLRKFKVDFSVGGADFRLHPEHEVILFRMCQEILNNAVKYSGASQIEINLQYEDDMLFIKIGDNGVGFDAAGLMKQGAGTESTGLDNIQVRAKLINAGVAVNSHNGQGTVYHISIPLSNAAGNP